MTIVDPSGIPGLGWYIRSDTAGQISGVVDGVGSFDLAVDRTANGLNLQPPAPAGQHPQIWTPSWEMNGKPAIVSRLANLQILTAATAAPWLTLSSPADSSLFFDFIPLDDTVANQVLIGTANGVATDIGFSLIYDSSSELITFQLIAGAGAIVTQSSAARSVLRGRLSRLVLWQSAGNWRLYQNGTVLMSGARAGMSGANPTYPLRVFAYAGSNGAYAGIELVEAGFYPGKALSDSELVDLDTYMQRYIVAPLASDEVPRPNTPIATGANTVVFLGNSHTLGTTGASGGYQGGVRRRVGDLFALISSWFFTLTQIGPIPGPYAANDGQSGSTTRGNTGGTPTNGHDTNSVPSTIFEIDQLFGPGMPYTGVNFLVMNIAWNNYGVPPADIYFNNNVNDVYQLGVNFHALEPQATIVLWNLTRNKQTVTGNLKRLRDMHNYALQAVVVAWRGLGMKVVYENVWSQMSDADISVDNGHMNDDGYNRDGTLIAKGLLIAGGVSPQEELISRLWGVGAYPVGSYTGLQ